MIRMLIALCLALLATTPAAAQLRGKPQAYLAAKALYDARKYPEAFNAFATLYNQPYGRTPLVVYHLASAACRTNQRDLGVRLFRNLLRSRQLNNKSAALVVQQMNNCGGAMLIAADISAGALVSSSGGSTKSFYWVDRASPVASFPAIRTRDIAPAELQARLILRSSGAAAIKAALKPGGCTPVVGTYVALCSANPRIAPDRLTAIVGEADRFVAFLQTRYGIRAPDEYVVIRLVPDVPAVQSLAAAIHGLKVSPATIAYSFHDDLSLVAVSQGGSGSILHELVHLAMRRDFGDAPAWFEEGLASLYEVAVECDGRFYGIDNWRGDVLRRIGTDRPTVADIIADDGKTLIGDIANPAAEEGNSMMRVMERADAEAKMRYMLLDLQDNGGLGDLYGALQRVGLNGDASQVGLDFLKSRYAPEPAAWDKRLHVFVDTARAADKTKAGICRTKATPIEKDLPPPPA